MLAIAAILFIFSLLFFSLLSLPLLAVPASAQFIWIMPSIRDPDFVVETFVAGIENPTAMAFVGDEGKDILVLQKNDGQVRLAVARRDQVEHEHQRRDDPTSHQETSVV